VHRRVEDLKGEMIYVKIEEEATPARCSQRLPPHVFWQCKGEQWWGYLFSFPALPDHEELENQRVLHPYFSLTWFSLCPRA
jgi:hypothetical protein